MCYDGLHLNGTGVIELARNFNPLMPGGLNAIRIERISGKLPLILKNGRIVLLIASWHLCSKDNLCPFKWTSGLYGKNKPNFIAYFPFIGELFE